MAANNQAEQPDAKAMLTILNNVDSSALADVALDLALIVMKIVANEKTRGGMTLEELIAHSGAGIDANALRLQVDAAKGE